jgi:hypothetical protein
MNDRCQPRGNIENQAGKFWVLQQRGQTDLFNYTAAEPEIIFKFVRQNFQAK